MKDTAKEPYASPIFGICAIAIWALLALVVPTAALAKAPLGDVTYFHEGLNAEAQPNTLTTGPDGNVWFIDGGATPAIGRVTPTGAITEFNTPVGEPSVITGGPDGNVWFTLERGQSETQTIKIEGEPVGGSFTLTFNKNTTEQIAFDADALTVRMALEQLPSVGPDNVNVKKTGTLPGPVTYTLVFVEGLGETNVPQTTCASSLTGDAPKCTAATSTSGVSNAIGRITPAGKITEFSSGLNSAALPLGIAEGPDGNLWFTDIGHTPAIGRITPTGEITEFSTGLDASAFPILIAAGPDGNLWFTMFGDQGGIGRITPTGEITKFTSGLASDAVPLTIAAGPDGNLWFTFFQTQAIGRITPTGEISEFSSGLSESSDPSTIIAGGDGNLWFTDAGAEPAIGRITPTGLITEFSLGEGIYPGHLAVGSDENLWFTVPDGPAIGRFGTQPMVDLTLNTNGTGVGTVQCAVEGGPVEACAATYPEGTDLTLLATASSGSEFVEWSGDCEFDGECEMTMDDDKSVAATFNLEPVNTFILAVETDGSGSGVVTSSPGVISCGAICTGEFVAGTEVILTATPAAGSSFSGWSSACSGVGTCKVTMAHSHSVGATFDKIPLGQSGLTSARGKAIVSRTAQIKAGKALLKVSCRGQGPCEGLLKLVAKLRVGKSGHSRAATVGKSSFGIAAGASTMLKVSLSLQAKQVLKRAGSLRARITGTGVKVGGVELKS